jgi:hypothetical protein
LDLFLSARLLLIKKKILKIKLLKQATKTNNKTTAVITV